MHLHRLVLPLLWLSRLSAADVSDATARDSNYYAAHRTNPNVRNSHYYADSSNVLQSLSQFDKLYVTYSGCVWSTYDGDDENSCGAGVDADDAYWYMGATECFRANAAYSLYGVLKGQKDKGCTQGTYINSFFTTAGVEAFTKSMVATGQISFSGGSNDDQDGEYPGGISSVCQTNNNNNRLLDEGGNNIQHNTNYYSNVGSSGLSCHKKKFVKKSFKGASCDASSNQQIKNHLSQFNAALKTAHCIPIYSRKNGNNQNDEDSPLSLLYNSNSCDIREYPHDCPDPFATLKQYAVAFEKSVWRTYNSQENRKIRAFSILFLVLGGLFIMCAVLVYLRRSRLSRVRSIKRMMKSKLKVRGRKQRQGGDNEQEDAPGRVSRLFRK